MNTNLFNIPDGLLNAVNTILETTKKLNRDTLKEYGGDSSTTNSPGTGSSEPPVTGGYGATNNHVPILKKKKNINKIQIRKGPPSVLPNGNKGPLNQTNEDIFDEEKMVGDWKVNKIFPKAMWKCTNYGNGDCGKEGTHTVSVERTYIPKGKRKEKTDRQEWPLCDEHMDKYGLREEHMAPSVLNKGNNTARLYKIAHNHGYNRTASQGRNHFLTHESNKYDVKISHEGWQHRNRATGKVKTGVKAMGLYKHLTAIHGAVKVRPTGMQADKFKFNHKGQDFKEDIDWKKTLGKGTPKLCSNCDKGMHNQYCSGFCGCDCQQKLKKQFCQPKLENSKEEHNMKSFSGFVTDIYEEDLDEVKKPAMPIKGHPYHTKQDNELHYIMKDSHEAMVAGKGVLKPHEEGKYADQLNDAATVLGYRRNGGKRVEVKEETELEEAFGTKKAVKERNLSSFNDLNWRPLEKSKKQDLHYCDNCNKGMHKQSCSGGACDCECQDEMLPKSKERLGLHDIKLKEESNMKSFKGFVTELEEAIELEEGRGRPRLNPNDVKWKGHENDDESNTNIHRQLSMASEVKEGHPHHEITFKNGLTHVIEPNLAKEWLTKHNSLKGEGKLAMQKFTEKGHGHFLRSINKASL